MLNNNKILVMMTMEIMIKPLFMVMSSWPLLSWEYID